MDIAIPQNPRAKMIRRLVLAGVALLVVTGISYGLSRLRPAAPHRHAGVQVGASGPGGCGVDAGRRQTPIDWGAGWGRTCIPAQTCTRSPAMGR